MNRWYGHVIIFFLLLSAGGLLVACDIAPETSSIPDNACLPAMPELAFSQESIILCRFATQIRLRPDVTGSWPEDAQADWQLLTFPDSTVLLEGTWSPASGDLLVAFPGGQPLEPGDYEVHLTLDTDELVQRFSVQDTVPRIISVTLSLTPAGPDVESLPLDVRVFYIRYAVEGICAGAPLWINVTHDDEVVCGAALALSQSHEEGAFACYLNGGAIFTAGKYVTTLTLMGETSQEMVFEVAAVPQVTTTPTSPPVVCDELFLSPALSANGEPFLPDTRFEWYTQAVFAGAYCRNLSARTPWSARWYRNGAEVQFSHSFWTGDSSAVVWDSLNGEPRFLLPGTYTVTLQIGTAELLTGSFRLIPYVREEDKIPD